MLKQMQRISAEECHPINEQSLRICEDQYKNSIGKQQNYCYQLQGKKHQSKCILNCIKKEHKKYIVAFIAILLILIACQICVKFYLFYLRANQYKLNLSLLKQYHFQGQNNLQQSQFFENKKDFEAFPNIQLVVVDNKTDQQEQQQKKIYQIQKKRTNFQDQSSFSIVISDETPNAIPSSATLNNYFDFQSGVVQDNLKISTNAPQIIFPAVEENVTQSQENQIPLIAYKKQKKTDGEINYEDYTGITVGQLQRAKIFTQIKFFQPTQTNTLIDSEREYYENKYKISKYEQLPICVVIPTYNNAVANRHINNMNSILMQDYSNYHIVFIDDASTDTTSDDIMELMNNQKKLDPSKYLLIKNSKQMRAMHNLRTAAQVYCQPQDIFIIIDGDDQLIGRQVFKLFNAMFQSTGAWFVYSNFLTIQNYVGFSRLLPKSVIQENNYRNYPFVTSHLRAFYTQLFRNIKEEDLRDKNGEYLKAANDVAICIPILEQAQDRVQYIPEITYFYNSETGLNNHHLRLKQQKRNDYRLRARPQYKRLDKLFD